MPEQSTNTYPPEEFADILKVDIPIFLVGGQAVNLWALYYYDKTNDLAPFVSHDIDILGDKSTLINLAKKLGVKPHFFPMRPPTNEVGVIMSSDNSGYPIPVEVLSHIHGVKNDELQHPHYSMSLGNSNTIVQIPGPISLLKAKIANVADIPQKGRQDDRHVKILLRLLPWYLKDVYSSVKSKKIKERELLNLLEKLLAIIISNKGKTVLTSLNTDFYSLFSELKPDDGSKIDSFIKKRIVRVKFE